MIDIDNVIDSCFKNIFHLYNKIDFEITNMYHTNIRDQSIVGR